MRKISYDFECVRRWPQSGVTKNVSMKLLPHLENNFDNCKSAFDSFVHMAIKHTKKKASDATKQRLHHKSMETSLFRETPEEDLVSTQAHEKYRSSLGEVAWTAMTQATLAVYIQSLQRRSHAPRGKDCKRLNMVIKYLKRELVSIFYDIVPTP